MIIQTPAYQVNHANPIITGHFDSTPHRELPEKSIEIKTAELIKRGNLLEKQSKLILTEGDSLKANLNTLCDLTSYIKQVDAAIIQVEKDCFTPTEDYNLDVFEKCKHSSEQLTTQAANLGKATNKCLKEKKRLKDLRVQLNKNSNELSSLIEELTELTQENSPPSTEGSKTKSKNRVIALAVGAAALIVFWGMRQ